MQRMSVKEILIVSKITACKRLNIEGSPFYGHTLTVTRGWLGREISEGFSILNNSVMMTECGQKQLAIEQQITLLCLLTIVELGNQLALQQKRRSTSVAIEYKGWSQSDPGMNQTVWPQVIGECFYGLQC